MNYVYNEIETERLKTRFLTEEDYLVWAHFLNDPESVRFFPNAKFQSTEERAVFWITKQLNRYKENRYGLHALIDKNTGEFIGQCGLLLQEVDGKKEVEVGYHVFRKYWGNGYAPEAAIAFKNYAFDNNLANSVVSIIHKDNFRSQNVALKNGMKKEKETTWMDLPIFLFRTQ